MSAAAHLDLDPSLHRLLCIVFANKFIQAYELTETYSMALGRLDNDYAVGTCGAVTPACEVSLPRCSRHRLLCHRFVASKR